MLLAIDIGNTDTVCGVWDGKSWRAVWRRATSSGQTEDELAVWFKGLFELEGLPMLVRSAICASVVPSANRQMELFCARWLGIELDFLKTTEAGIAITYDPPSAVGADRVANAVGALEKYQPPIVVVDFGTATTFDAIDSKGAYVGGAILPGVAISTEALIQRTAKLPQIEYKAPHRAVGRSTVESLQSGIMLGYADAIDGLAGRFRAELGASVRVVATGGLGALFIGLCQSIEAYEPTLTLEGLRIVGERLAKERGRAASTLA